MPYCLRCGKELKNGSEQKPVCVACKLAKFCSKCGVALTSDNWYPSFMKRNVPRCISCQNKAVAERDAANPGDARKRTARWRDRNPDHAKEYYQRTIDAHANRARERLWKFKTEAINKLGGKCAKCGVTDARILQINHVNGGGTKEKRFGIDMYKAIVDGTRQTEDLNVLCPTCNILYEYERGTRRLPDGVKS